MWRGLQAKGVSVLERLHYRRWVDALPPTWPPTYEPYEEELRLLPGGHLEYIGGANRIIVLVVFVFLFVL